MCFPAKIQLPNELLSELANAFRFDFRWSVLRVSSSIFDHFLAKRQQKILQNVHLYFQQHGGSDNVVKHFANFQNKMSLPMSNVPIHEAVLAARVLISADTGNFNELFAFLESHKFALKIHSKLQQIWWDAHFFEAKKTLGKSLLSPLERYKVREEHPLPPTIWDGQRKRSFFNENTMALLNEKFAYTKYVAVTERWEMAEATGLSETQVKNWFVNRRFKWRQGERKWKSELWGPNGKKKRKETEK
ncbi:hypothetical protein niasHS_014219 [Heterodera schachtii]|uniref:Homeobox domain-containing protein n=1 Tax=Heterodera schachtii TaxID=97005 RepID=A0ABD2I2Q0_HETSC